MALVDEIKVHMKAGRGGDGVVRWRHEKGKEFSGASGGNGGRGGNVFARAVRDLAILARYRNTKEFAASNGESGMRSSKQGKEGDDLTIDVPIGSILTNLATGKKHTLIKDGESVELLAGGRGGLGNEHFKASTNVTPFQSTPGRAGEEADFLIELELVADAGLVGFPNAGKSSLLNVLTNAEAKVGAYAFTTLEPNLGSMEGYILADIPGLIEGAAEGKGLGDKFLRHIKRTKIIIHCISLENEDIGKAYEVIRNELAAFNPILAEKQEILILTKTDTTTPEIVKTKIKEAKKLNKSIFTVSVLDDESVKDLKDNLVKILRKAE